MPSFENIAPAKHTFLITPDDDTNLSPTTRAISFAGAGTLHIIDGVGEEVTIPDGALAAGTMWAIEARKVFADGTTATGIVGYA